MMGSATGAAAEAVHALRARGQRVGLLKVRLFRPFSAEHLLAARPPAVQRGRADDCRHRGVRHGAAGTDRTLVAGIYAIRRALEEIELWRRHYW